MIIHKGVHMKRPIALLMAVAFCISIFAVPISAVCPDPNNTRFVRGGMPNGDEGAWNEADSPGDNGVIEVLSYFGLYSSKYFIIYLVPKDIKKDKPLDENDPGNLTDTHAGRTAPPR